LRAEQTQTQAAKSAWENEKQRADKLDAELADSRKNQAIRDAASHLDGGLEFHDLPMVTELVKGFVVLDKDSNSYVVKINGVVKMNNSLTPMTLSEYFVEFATQRPYLVKSQAKAGAGSQESGTQGQVGVGVIRSRADLKTVLQKTDYINKFGYDAYAKLPIR
jgi:hypothetical protein